jgi:hypothetical protein
MPGNIPENDGDQPSGPIVVLVLAGFCFLLFISLEISHNTSWHLP